MILTDSSGKTYAAHFHHRRPLKVLARVNIPVHYFEAQTTCTVHEGKCKLKKRPCETPGSVIGLAICSVNDQFVKFKGRKIALGRALIALKLDKKTRTELWRDFLYQTTASLLLNNPVVEKKQ